jgi:DNA segregation ATPase FtsK/SpoIIIE, S-DNA-T family
MPKKGLTESPESPVFKRKGARPRPFLALLCLIITVLATLALLDFHPSQTGRFSTESPDSNLIGLAGTWFAFNFIQWIGLAAWCIPLAFLWGTYLFFRSYAYVLNLRKLIALLLIILATAVFAQITQVELFNGDTSPVASHPNYFPYGMGGWLGELIYEENFREWLSMVGTLVVFGILALFSLAFLLGDNLASDLSKRVRDYRTAWAEGAEARRKAREERRKLKEVNQQAAAARGRVRQQLAEAETASAGPAPAPRRATAAPAEVPAEGSAPPFPEKAGGFSLFGGKRKKKNTRAPQVAPETPTDAPAEARRDSAAPFEPLVEPEMGETVAPRQAARPRAAKVPPAAPPAEAPLGPGGLRIIASERTRKANIQLPSKKGDYTFPPMKLLSDPDTVSEADTADAHQHTADALVQTLEQFGVKVTMGEVHAGPVITRYDIYPAPGVRVERIANLDKNLALGLKALSVRILAPVPGKGCVGIEVPNRHPQSVVIRDILESEDWAKTKAEIPVALGKEVSGKPLIADLTKMPHLLIAGSTGSGKTVCINAIITSLLYHSSPEDLRFVMVDPKIVEMKVYNDLPHMMIPVVTDPKKVPNALKYLLNEMERRYQMFAEIGVRNIAGYNAKMAKDRQSRDAAELRAAELDANLTPEERAAAAAAVSVPRDPDLDGELPERLPYVVCIVDELADLMMVAPADIETGIARLAQLARAAGIHLILATQRPSVNVITGVIKANLPSRIAFKVASKVDSRTILDIGGADQLIGKGDMLFLPPGSADLVRSQGAFVGDEEIAGIVKFIADHNGEPVFDEQFRRSVEEGEEADGPESPEGEWDDDLVPDAIEVIRSSKRASTSMLQRRLKIGYNRAARIMEILEDEGIVGPENGSSPREILRDLDAL